MVYEKEVTFPAVTICESYYVQENDCLFNNKQCRLAQRSSGCYVFNRGINKSYYPIEIFKSAIPGRNNGLILYLYPKYESQIELHLNNHSTDYDSKKAIYVSKGMEVNIILKRVLSSKLSSPYNNCKKDYIFEPKPLDILNQTSYPYFQSECFLLCKYEMRMEICKAEFNSYFQYYFTNRGHFWDVFLKYSDDCTQKDPSLISSINAKFDSLGANTICEKKCPIACDSMSYSISSIIEQPKMTFDSLIGTIGGLLGLFLGASLISFYEIIDLVISTIHFSLQHLKKESQYKITEQPISTSAVISSDSVLRFLRI